jgi:hypothetical protein
LVITQSDQPYRPPLPLSPLKQQRAFQAAVKPVLSHLTLDLFALRQKQTLVVVEIAKKVVQKAVKKAVIQADITALKVVVPAKKTAPKTSQSGRVYKPKVWE